MNRNEYSICIWGAGFLVAEGLKSVFNRDIGFTTTQFSGSFSRLVETLGQSPCDILIIDVSAAGFDDTDFRALQAVPGTPAVLLLLDSLTHDRFRQYTEAGIKNIVLKSASGQEFLNAAEAAADRRKYFSSEILEMVLDSMDSKAQKNPVNGLTPSEMEIVRLIAGGMTTKQIAARRNISFHTVNTHRKNIFRKLKVSNASELTMKAIKAGWIDNIEYYI